MLVILAVEDGAKRRTPSVRPRARSASPTHRRRATDGVSLCVLGVFCCFKSMCFLFRFRRLQPVCYSPSAVHLHLFYLYSRSSPVRFSALAIIFVPFT